jgi:integrase
LVDQFVWDDALPGFGLKVTPSGRKVYVMQYRVAGLGRRAFARRVTLGEHGTLTPDEARKLARRELGRVAQGSDPAAERSRWKTASTVAEVGTAYLDDVRARRASDAADYERRRLWDKHVVPVIGSKLVAKVTAVDVRRLHRAMHETPYLANRVVGLLRSVFAFAGKEGLRPVHDNPAMGVDPYPEENRERFLTPDEFRRLGEALDRAETIGLLPAPKKRRKPKLAKNRKHVPKSAGTPIPAARSGVAAIRLLATTGCRENEILSLRWDAVDFERGFLRLAGTKTGRSTRPLGEAAMAILRALPAVEGSPFVLPGKTSEGHIKELRRLWEAVRYAAGLEDVRLHDLRHSFASVPATSGESMLVVRSLLGHANVATTERYAHLADDPVKRAADRTAADIAAWMGGAQTPITPLRLAE